jgi:hypothetical protein
VAIESIDLMDMTNPTSVETMRKEYTKPLMMRWGAGSKTLEDDVWSAGFCNDTPGSRDGGDGCRDGGDGC